MNCKVTGCTNQAKEGYLTCQECIDKAAKLVEANVKATWIQGRKV